MFPVLYNIFLQLIYFIHSCLYLLIPYSYLTFRPSLCPLRTTSLFCLSVSLFLFCYIHLFASFLDSTYKWYHTIFVFLHQTYFTKHNTLPGPSMLLKMEEFYSLLWLGRVFPHIYLYILFYSCSVLSDSLRPHGPQHTRLLCPPLSPRVCSSSCPLSQQCYQAILSSAATFSFCLQSFPALGSFPMSQFFISDGQSIEASASASVLPMNIQGWFPLELTGLISLLSKGLSRVLQHHNSKAPVLWCSAFFMVHCLHPYVATGKNHRFDYTDLCRQSNISAFSYAI